MQPPRRHNINAKHCFTSGNEAQHPGRLRVVHVSDTHDRDHNIPSGDVFIHSGDFTNQGTQEEVQRFNRYLCQLPHKYKVVVPGNHEFGCDRLSKSQLEKSIFQGVPGECHLLIDSAVTIEGIHLYGSPWNNSHNQAWGVPTEERRKMWKKIPKETEILITHVPPFNVLDLAWQKSQKSSELCTACGLSHKSYAHWGCVALMETLHMLPNLRLHCFGHVHDQPGIAEVSTSKSKSVVCSNAAVDLNPVCNVIDVYPEGQLQSMDASPGMVLDVDAMDPNGQTLMMWKKLRGGPANQVWRVERHGLGFNEKVVLASAVREDAFLTAIPDSGRGQGWSLGCLGSDHTAAQRHWIVEGNIAQGAVKLVNEASQLVLTAIPGSTKVSLAQSDNQCRGQMWELV